MPNAEEKKPVLCRPAKEGQAMQDKKSQDELDLDFQVSAELEERGLCDKKSVQACAVAQAEEGDNVEKSELSQECSESDGFLSETVLYAIKARREFAKFEDKLLSNHPEHADSLRQICSELKEQMEEDFRRERRAIAREIVEGIVRPIGDMDRSSAQTNHGVSQEAGEEELTLVAPLTPRKVKALAQLPSRIAHDEPSLKSVSKRLMRDSAHEVVPGALKQAGPPTNLTSPAAKPEGQGRKECSRALSAPERIQGRELTAVAPATAACEVTVHNPKGRVPKGILSLKTSKRNRRNNQAILHGTQPMQILAPPDPPANSETGQELAEMKREKTIKEMKKATRKEAEELVEKMSQTCEEIKALWDRWLAESGRSLEGLEDKSGMDSSIEFLNKTLTRSLEISIDEERKNIPAKISEIRQWVSDEERSETKMRFRGQDVEVTLLVTRNGENAREMTLVPENQGGADRVMMVNANDEGNERIVLWCGQTVQLSSDEEVREPFRAKVLYDGGASMTLMTHKAA